jgi:hypothetical protein
VTPFDNPTPAYTLDPPPSPSPAAPAYTLDPPPAPASAPTPTPAYTLDPPPPPAPAGPGLGADTAFTPGDSATLGGVAATVTPTPRPDATLGPDTAFTPADSPTLGGVVSTVREGSNQLDDSVLGAAGRFGAGWMYGSEKLQQNYSAPTFSPPTPADTAPEPQDTASRVGSGLAQSSPVVAAGIMGGTVGSAVGAPFGGVGALVGAPIGAGLGMFVADFAGQLRPNYVNAITNLHMDHDAAVNYALEKAATSGAITGLTGPLFELAPIKSMLGRMLFNSTVTAPAVGTAGRVITPAVMGEPMPSGEELGQGAISDVLGGLALGGAFEGVRAAREGVRGEGFRMPPGQETPAEPQPKAQSFDEMYPPEKTLPAPTRLLPAPASAEPPAPVPPPTPEPPAPAPVPAPAPAPAPAPVPSQIRPDETGTGAAALQPGATPTTQSAGADTGVGAGAVATPAAVAPPAGTPAATSETTTQGTPAPLSPPSPVSPPEQRTPVDDHTPSMSGAPAPEPANVPAAGEPGTDAVIQTGAQAQPVVGSEAGRTDVGQAGVGAIVSAGEGGGGLAVPEAAPFTSTTLPKLNGAASNSAEFQQFSQLARTQNSPVFVRNEGGFWRQTDAPPKPPIDYAIFHPDKPPVYVRQQDLPAGSGVPSTPAPAGGEAGGGLRKDELTPAERAKSKFDQFIKTLPEAHREEIEQIAWENSFAQEVHKEYRDDEHRWDVALSTAENEADQRGLLEQDPKTRKWVPKGTSPAPTQSSPSPSPASRPAQILAELDARNAPDADYRTAFSTGSKEPLAPGETWRQRLVDWVERTKGTDTPPEPVPEPPEPPIFDHAPEVPAEDQAAHATVQGILNDLGITLSDEDIARAGTGGDVSREVAADTGGEVTPEEAAAQKQLADNETQIAALKTGIAAIEDKGAALTPVQGRQLQAKKTQLQRLQRSQDELARQWTGKRARKPKVPPKTIPGAPEGYDEFKTNTGTSIYQQAFIDAGHDPRLATSYPIRRQVEILRTQTARTFGFKDVIVTGDKQVKEAVDQLLDLYRGTHDMMASLVVPLKQASLDGELTIHLHPVQTGKDNKWLGYYDPKDRSIHLAGRANSFAHEWIHAFDHKLSEMLAVDPQRSNLLSRHTRKGMLDPKDSMQARFAKLINAHFYDEGALAAKKITLQIEARKTNQQGQPTLAAKKALAALEAIEKGAVSGHQIQSTDFRHQALQLPNPRYWASEAELLARSGEAFVARLMEQNGTDPRGVAMPDRGYSDVVDQRLKALYAKEEEQVSIFTAWADVLHGLRMSTAFGSPAAAMSHDMGMLDAAGYARLAASAGGAAPRAVPIMRRIAEWWRRTADAAAEEVTLFDKSRPTPSRVIGKRSLLGFQKVLDSKASLFDAIIKLQPPKAAKILQELRDKIGVVPGSGRPVPESFEERSRGLMRTSRGELADILKVHDLKRMDAETNAMLRHGLITGEGTYNGRLIPQNVRSAVGRIRKLLNDHWEMNDKAGIPIGYARNGMFPRIYDHAKISTDQNGFRADAAKVYRLMFDQEIGAAGDDPAALLGKWTPLEKVSKELVEANNPGITRDMQRLAENLKRQREIENMPPAVQGAYAGELANLKTEAEQLALQHHDTIGDFIGNEFADDWVTRLAIGYPGDYDTVGPSGNYLNHRVLPPEADLMLAKWMINDVPTVLTHYLERSANKIAYTEQFGYGEDNEIERLLKAASKAGMYGDGDGQLIRGLINSITGRTTLNGNIQHRVMGTASNVLHAFGATALMPRSPWHSLHEPIVGSMMTGDAMVGLKAFGFQLQAILRRNDARERALLADFLGVTMSHLSETLMASRTGANYDDTPWLNKLTLGYYRTIGLTGLTNSVRRAVMGSMDWFLRKRIAEDFLNTNQTADGEKARWRATRWLNELGIPRQRQEDFARWLAAHDGMPSMDELKNHPMRPLYSIAIRRLVDWSSQDPYKADRPLMAEDPWGRMIFQFGIYAYGFQRNVIDRSTRVVDAEYHYEQERAERDATAKGETIGKWGKRFAGARGAAGTAAGHLSGAALLVLTATLATIASELVFNRKRFMEHIDDNTIKGWLFGLGTSRSGIIGTYDMPTQWINGLRYTSNIAIAMEGAAAGFAGQNLTALAQGLASIFDPNAPETNTRAHEATKAVYNLFGIPVLAWIAMKLSAAGGPYLSPAAMFMLQYLSSAPAAEKFADTLTGKKGTPAPKPPATGPDSLEDISPQLKMDPDELSGDELSGDSMTTQEAPKPANSAVNQIVPWLDDMAKPLWTASRPLVNMIPAQARWPLLGIMAGSAAARWVYEMAPYRAQSKATDAAAP